MKCVGVIEDERKRILVEKAEKIYQKYLKKIAEENMRRRTDMS